MFIYHFSLKKKPNKRQINNLQYFRKNIHLKREFLGVFFQFIIGYIFKKVHFIVGCMQ